MQTSQQWPSLHHLCYIISADQSTMMYIILSLQTNQQWHSLHVSAHQSTVPFSTLSVADNLISEQWLSLYYLCRSIGQQWLSSEYLCRSLSEQWLFPQITKSTKTIIKLSAKSNQSTVTIIIPFLQSSQSTTTTIRLFHTFNVCRLQCRDRDMFIQSQSPICLLKHWNLRTKGAMSG